MLVITISSKTYTYQDFLPFLKGPVTVRIDHDIKEKIKASHQQFAGIMARGDKIYGVNTGFGKLSQMTISESDQKQLQLNLIRSHAAGVGEPLDLGLTRIIIFLKLLTFSKGASGVRFEVANQILQFLKFDILPVIPRQGSVGASGDLAPLAHEALALIGEGDVFYQKRQIPSELAMQKAGLNPLVLHPKEGLSLINGTQFSTALAISVLIQSENLLKTADVAGALTAEASLSSRNNFKPEIHRLKKHKAQIQSAINVWNILEKSEIVLSHKNCGRMQDPYSVRCIPQVHGASREMINHASSVVNSEMNSVSDNPVILGNDQVYNSGHFHGEFIAQAMDSSAIAMSEIGSISQKRIHFLMKGIGDVVPPFIAHNPGLESGLMIAHVTMAALASENKTLSHPASVDSISTSGGQEDFVSMAPWASVKALTILKNIVKILAIEIFVSVNVSLFFHKKLKPGIGCQPVFNLLKKQIKFIKGDHIIYKDIEVVSALNEEGKIVSSVQKQVSLG